MAGYYKERRLHILLLIFLGLLAYSNTFDVPFQFDDYIFVEHRNEELRIASVAKEADGISSMSRGPWASRPLLYATFVLNHSLDGYNTRGYHAVNLALHITNAVLLYLLVVMTGRHLEQEEKNTIPVALLSSALFVLHPMETEAVLSIVNRSMLMATTAYLSSLILFLKAVTSEGREKTKYSIGLFIAALLGAASRENFATLPIMLIVYDLLFVSRFRLRATAGHYREYAAALLGVSFLGYLVLTNTYSKFKDFQDIAIPPFQYALTQFKIHWMYIRMLIFPINQSLDHDYSLAKSLIEFPTPIYFIGYMGLWVGGLSFASRKPTVSFGLLWFLITLLPISFGVAFLDIRLGDPIFEHRLYLPSVGLIMLTALGLVHLARKRKALVPTIVVLCIILGGATYARNYVWKDAGELWGDVVRKAPNHHRGHNNLGTYLSMTGFIDEAIKHFEIAEKLAPNNGQIHNNLGVAYFKKGNVDKAIEHLNITLSLLPQMAVAHSSLGTILFSEGQYQDALYRMLAASYFDPLNTAFKNNVSKAYYALGQKEEAISYLVSSLQLNKNQPEALHNIVVLFIETGQKERAITHLEALLQLQPGHIPARVTLAKLYSEEDKPFLAIQHLQEALKLRPGQPEIHRAIAEAYRKVGNMESADEHILKAETLEKSFASKDP